MDTSLSIIIAVAIVVAIALVLVVYRYRGEIGLSFKGFGFQARLGAKGGTTEPSSARNVTIGRDASDNRIVTGDGTAAKNASAGGRNVSIGRDAKRNTIVTGDGDKTG
jgi:ABC-type uncharacterized transport system permease subunit